MRLAVSNIAWEPNEEPTVARLLADLGVAAVEIAPTKVFDQPEGVAGEQARAYRRFWQDFGIDIVAFQSILYEHRDLRIFRSAEEQAEFVRISGRFIELAHGLGANRIVFGSPLQREVTDDTTQEAAWEAAVDMFGRIASHAERFDVTFCIEPNPPVYGCNFVTNAASGARLVQDVARRGFGLHLDAAGMTLAGEDVATSIRESADFLQHFHLSAPQLGVLDPSVVDYEGCLAALSDADYDHTVSIEMRPSPGGDNLDRVRHAVTIARAAATARGITL